MRQPDIHPASAKLACKLSNRELSGSPPAFRAHFDGSVHPEVWITRFLKQRSSQLTANSWPALCGSGKQANVSVLAG